MKQIFEWLREEIEANSVDVGGTNIISMHRARILVNKAEEKWEEKQFAKKPLVNKCPSCHKTVFYVENYCPNCGQHLKWDEVE